MKYGFWMVPTAVCLFVGTFVSSIYIPFKPKVDSGYGRIQLIDNHLPLTSQNANSFFYAQDQPVANVNVTEIPGTVILDSTFTGIAISADDTTYLSYINVQKMGYVTSYDDQSSLYISFRHFYLAEDTITPIEKQDSFYFRRRDSIAQQGNNRHNIIYDQLARQNLVVRIGFKGDSPKKVFSFGNCRQLLTNHTLMANEFQLSINQVDSIAIRLNARQFIMSALGEKEQPLRISLSGKTDRFNLQNIQMANLDAATFEATECYVGRAVLCDLYIHATEIINARYMDQSNLKIVGNPPYRNINRAQ